MMLRFATPDGYYLSKFRIRFDEWSLADLYEVDGISPEPEEDLEADVHVWLVGVPVNGNPLTTGYGDENLALYDALWDIVSHTCSFLKIDGPDEESHPNHYRVYYKDHDGAEEFIRAYNDAMHCVLKMNWQGGQPPEWVE